MHAMYDMHDPNRSFIWNRVMLAAQNVGMRCFINNLQIRVLDASMLILLVLELLVQFLQRMIRLKGGVHGQIIEIMIFSPGTLLLTLILQYSSSFFECRLTVLPPNYP